MNARRNKLSGPLRGLLIVGAILGGAFLVSRRESAPSPGPPDRRPAEEAFPTQTPYFTDMTASSGLAFTSQNGEEADHRSIGER
jgi:hypothetical protein